MQSSLEKSFAEKFDIENLLIKKTMYWLISLRPQQPTIGSMVLSLNRQCEKLSDISQNEARDLSDSFKFIEKILQASLKPAKINYLALMMIDNQVHFHVLPRYNDKILFEDQVFEDKQWPGPPSLDPIEINDDQLNKLLQLLRSQSDSILIW